MLPVTIENIFNYLYINRLSYKKVTKDYNKKKIIKLLLLLPFSEMCVDKQIVN